jgi:hypothetical protein
VEARIAYFKLEAAAEYIGRKAGVVITADEVLLAGVTQDLTICAYFPAGEMFNQTTKQLEPFTAQYLSIPAYLLKQIEALGCATVTYATDMTGIQYSPLVERTRDQLRVLACYAEELIVRLVAQQVAEADGAAATKGEPNLRAGTSRGREGVTKGQALAAFGSVVEIDLKSAFEDGPKWIQAARLHKGSRGGKHPSVWCPVMLAVCLHKKHQVHIRHLNKVFHDCPYLNRWRDEWTEKAEDLA